MNRYASMILGAVIAGIIAAAPLASSGQKPAVIAWGGIAAACTYAKGKLEEKP